MTGGTNTTYILNKLATKSCKLKSNSFTILKKWNMQTIVFFLRHGVFNLKFTT